MSSQTLYGKFHCNGEAAINPRNEEIQVLLLGDVLNLRGRAMAFYPIDSEGVQLDVCLVQA